MLTKKQLNIFEPLTKNILKEYSIREIKNAAGEKSNNAITLALKKFKQEDLVMERRVGKSLLYSLNLDNGLVFDYISILNLKKMPLSAMKSISVIKENLEKVTLFFSIVVFGSYSIGKQKRDSDLDVAVFIENKEKKSLVEGIIKSAELKTILKIHPQVIDEDEFLEMLKTDDENLGKQIARKHLSIYNSSIFYSILKKGIKNGFRY